MSIHSCTLMTDTQKNMLPTPRKIILQWVFVGGMALIPCLSMAQRAATATGRIEGQDGNHRDVADVVLTLRHQEGVSNPRVAIDQAGGMIQDLDRIRLNVTRTGVPFQEFFLLMNISRGTTRPGSDVPPATILTTGRSQWVRDNTGQLIAAEVDTGSLNASATPPVASIRPCGASFLARVRPVEDGEIQPSIPDTHADMRGIRLGLEDAMATLAGAIKGRLSGGESVSRDGVLFVPHDDGRKAAPFILQFKVKKPSFLWFGGEVSQIFIPVSFVVSRNAARDGYNVSVNPADTTNRDRITVVQEGENPTGGQAILDAAKNAVASLPAGFYEVPRERMERAIRDARPAGRAAPADFDIITFPDSSSLTSTSATASLHMRILE